MARTLPPIDPVLRPRSTSARSSPTISSLRSPPPSRKFVEAEPHYPEASEILDQIGQLYAIEAEAKRASPEERLAALAALRAKQSKPVLDEIRTWLMM